MSLDNNFNEYPPFKHISDFDWDNGNTNKNWIKHGVHPQECESIFSYKMVVIDDSKHSHIEKRYTVFGVTSEGRLLYVAITIRNNKIRVISARDQSKRERKFYFDTLSN
jgi:uncharacterized DUF497 family protein